MQQEIVYERDAHLFGHGHGIILGHTGSAKTSFMERISQKKFGDGNKIIWWDLNGECSLYGFKETEPALVELIESPYFKQKPRAYPHRVLIPMIVEEHSNEKNVVVQYPRHILPPEEQTKRTGYTYWRPYKIPFSSLKSEEFQVLMQRLTDTGKSILGLITNFSQFKNMEDLMRAVVEVMDKESPKFVGVQSDTGQSAKIGFQSTFASLITMLAQVQRSGFICGEKEKITCTTADGKYEWKIPAAIDILQIMRNPKIIDTFEFAGVGNEAAAVSYYVFGAQISYLRKRNKCPPMCSFMPEFHNYDPKTPAYSKLSKKDLSPARITELWLSEFRKQGVDVWADTQDPDKIDSVSMGHFTWWAIGRNPWPREFFRQKAMPFVPDDIIPKFRNFEKGTFFIAQLGNKEFWYPVFGCPSLAKHKERHLDRDEFIEEQQEQDKFLEMINYTSIIPETIRSGIFSKVVQQGFNESTFTHPTDFQRTINMETAKKMRSAGATMELIARTFGVSTRAIYKWFSNDREGERGIQLVGGDSTEPSTPSST